MNKKPRVVFAFTEAGLGHIMPLKSIADCFEKKYGDKVEIVRSNFFTESNDPTLIKYENFLINEVKKHNKHGLYGHATTFLMNVFGTTLGSRFAMKWFAPRGTYKRAISHVDELNADVLVSTHWATNYYAMHSKNRPLTLTYVPDTFINPVFRYKTDITLCSMKTGYDDALKHHSKRYKSGDLKLVPFCIRNEAYDYNDGKIENRKKLGISLDKFVITLAEGGYGIGKIESICKTLLEKDLPVVLIPICGKNKELYDRLSSLKNGKNAEIRPLSFTPDVFGYIASSDLFCGKSGNMIAEPTFFGVPSIITKHATNIEKHIGDYYEKYLKCALTILDLNKIIKKIEEFIEDRTKLEPLVKNALNAHDKYGAETSADYVYELLKRKYPKL